MRAGAVVYALEQLRETGLIPRKMKRSTLPRHSQQTGWNNFAKVLKTLWVHYCYAQGLTRSSDLAREVQIYLCHGKGVQKQKLVPVIAIIHKKVQTGIHRFTHVDKIQKHWAALITLLTKVRTVYRNIRTVDNVVRVADRNILCRIRSGKVSLTTKDNIKPHASIVLLSKNVYGVLDGINMPWARTRWSRNRTGSLFAYGRRGNVTSPCVGT